MGRGRNVFVCGLCIILLLSSCATLRSFRREPRGERLERIKASPNWEDGRFRNVSGEVDPDEPGWFPYTFTLLTIGGKARPSCPIPCVRTDLHSLGRERDCIIWFGHASVFLQLGGVRWLMDPVFTNVFPQRMLLRPFKGTVVYTPDDIPEIDVLLISHCHWDHLDYFTVTAIKERVGKVVCPLGVGEYFEFWGYPKEKIVELDWEDSFEIPSREGRCAASVKALPAVHNSRRFSAQDRTLWMSAIIETPSASLPRVFISGDGGWGQHFTDIARRFSPIDLAIMENGQYGECGGSVHSRPEELVREIETLSPRIVMTYHNGKYSLAKHSWSEPLDLAYEYAQSSGRMLLTPEIGEPVFPGSGSYPVSPWWRDLACYKRVNK